MWQQAAGGASNLLKYKPACKHSRLLLHSAPGPCLTGCNPNASAPNAQASRPTLLTRRWPRSAPRRAAWARGATWWWCCATATRCVCVVGSCVCVIVHCVTALRGSGRVGRHGADVILDLSLLHTRLHTTQHTHTQHAPRLRSGPLRSTRRSRSTSWRAATRSPAASATAVTRCGAESARGRCVCLCASCFACGCKDSALTGRNRDS